MKGNGEELSEFGAKCEERKRESKGADGGRDDSKKDDHNLIFISGRLAPELCVRAMHAVAPLSGEYSEKQIASPIFSGLHIVTCQIRPARNVGRQPINQRFCSSLESWEGGRLFLERLSPLQLNCACAERCNHDVQCNQGALVPGAGATG